MLFITFVFNHVIYKNVFPCEEHDILQINRKLTKSKTGKNAQNADFSDEKIKRRRKKKIEMVRKFSCPATKCTKTYGFA